MPSDSISHLRRAFMLSALGLYIAAFAPQAVWANDDDDRREDRDDNGDDDDDSDDDDDRDDNSGPGGDDDDDDDDDDDNSGPSGNDQGRNDNRDDNPRNDSRPSGSIRNITVTYTDGWIERINNGQYELFDNLNRRVIRRNATPEDFDRMLALR